MEGTILVVDDSEVNLLVSRTKLEEVGFRIETVTDGEAALSALALDGQSLEDTYDAVLLDIMMPGIDGYEVLERIRKRRSPIELPVIITTAKDRTVDVLRALSLGANDYVTKPLNLSVLVARLETHLRLRKAHRELKEAQKALMSAARIESVGFLAAGVAHEIRNPLGRIQMSVGGLRGILEQLPEESQETANLIIDTLEESVESADVIIRSLMQAANQQQLQLQPVDLSDWISELGKGLDQKCREANVQLKIKAEAGTRKTLLAFAEFRQVVDSLVDNALQSLQGSPDGDRKITLETSETTLENDLVHPGGRSGNRMRKGEVVSVLSIRDNGSGIDHRHLESIFDPFFSTRSTGTGTGLGLTIVRKIIELHKGEISITNRNDPKTGVHVKIYLKTEGGLKTQV